MRAVGVPPVTAIIARACLPCFSNPARQGGGRTTGSWGVRAFAVRSPAGRHGPPKGSKETQGKPVIPRLRLPSGMGRSVNPLMTMPKTTFIALSMMVSGLMFAQTTPTPTAPMPGQHHGPRGGNPDLAEQRFEQRLAQHLNLTAEQQNMVHLTRADARVQSQGMNEKMRTLHTSLNTAIKAGNESQIDSISQEIASMHQQQTSINAKTTARIYSTLTADQKAKVGNRLEILGGEGGFGRGPGFGPGPGGPGRRGGRGPGPAPVPQE
jgi:Spy/CpxP family protein refolding chaperone